MKKFNQLAKKKILKIFLSKIKTKVAIKFRKKKKKFLPKIGLMLKELKTTKNTIKILKNQ